MWVSLKMGDWPPNGKRKRVKNISLFFNEHESEPKPLAEQTGVGDEVFSAYK